MTLEAAKRLRSEKVIACTGTPFRNHVHELGSIAQILCIPHLSNIRKFDLVVNRLTLKDDPDYTALRLLGQLYMTRSISFEGKEHRLPTRIETVLRVDLDAEQRKLYDNQFASEGGMARGNQAAPREIANSTRLLSLIRGYILRSGDDAELALAGSPKLRLLRDRLLARSKENPYSANFTSEHGSETGVKTVVL